MKNKVGTALYAISIAAAGGFTQSHAADWTITPVLGISETYTDDVDLDTTIAQSEFVTRTTVGVNILSDGPRLDFNMNYALSHLYYPGLEGDKDEFRNSLTADSSAELLNDFLFLDANASITEQFIDRRNAFSSVNITVSENRATVGIIGVSPYVLRRVGGNFATFRVGYNFDQISANRSGQVRAPLTFGDLRSDIHEAEMSLTSGTRFTKLTWGFNNSYRTINATDRGQDDLFASNIQADYQIVREFAFIASLGIGDRQTNRNVIDYSGETWSFGGRLTPGPRTVLQVTYGQEVFGKAFNALASYQITPNLAFEATYQDRQERADILFIDNFIGGGQVDPVINQGFIDGNFIRFKNVNMSIIGTRGRSTITLNGGFQDSNSEIFDQSFIRYYGSVRWQRTLSSRLSLELNGIIMSDKFENAPEADVFYNGSAAINYLVSADILMTLEYIHTERKQQLFNFVQLGSNFITLGFAATF